MRILVIGCSGAGKTTLGRKLACELDIPHYSLDRYFWQPGWVESDEAEFDAKVAELIQGTDWVMDGNYSRTLPLRLERAGTVVWLDPSRMTCLWRALWRFVTHIGRVREDMGPGCPEQMSLSFIQWIWNFRQTHFDKQHRLLAGWLGRDPEPGWTEGQNGRRLWWGSRWPRNGCAELKKRG